MSSERIESSKDAVFRRRVGMDAEGRARLRDANTLSSAWWTTCRKCGTRREGTMTTLRDRCGCADA